MNILPIVYLGYTLDQWLAVNFFLGIFWALLRVFNIGLILYIYGMVDTDRVWLTIGSVDGVFNKKISILLNFLFGLPKTILLFVAILTTISIWVGLLAFAIIFMFIPWVIKKLFLYPSAV